MSTIGKKICGHGAFFRRLEEGHTITERRAREVIRSFSDQWPAGLTWPKDVSRPSPIDDGPSGRTKAAA